MAFTPEHDARINAVLSLLNQYEAFGFEIPENIADKRAKLNATTNIAAPPTALEIANASADEVPALLERVAISASFSVAQVKVALDGVVDAFRGDVYGTVVNDPHVIYDVVADHLNKALDPLNKDVASVPHAFAVNPATWDSQTKEALAGLKKLRAELPNLASVIALFTYMVTHIAPVRLGNQPELQGVAHLVPFYGFAHLESPALDRLVKGLPNAAPVSVEMATYLKAFDVFLNVASLEERTNTEATLNRQAKMFCEQDGELIPVSEARELQDHGGFPMYSGAAIIPGQG
ncbi:hypothetical protein [Amycolatopsis sp. Poz14]|uniref:hypothetical protein n=1 Tax=Amycolatopsis sp. Poz14 TaxID=1447705 RepID=UPI001EE7F2A1|nr:hypothetical protein [Amycolatopsis sp. Poz14]MCG3754681.1 hypothetical protein [Amycolatopsis sp. Poz14]